MRPEDFIRRADELIAMVDPVLKTRFSDRFGREWVDEGKFNGFRSAGLSFLLQTFGDRHPYYREFAERVKHNGPGDTAAGREIIRSAQAEVAGGWAVRLRDLVSAEIFADFLEMATYLLSEGYKDPAAVLTGSVLEEHLRQLCTRNDIETEIEVDGRLAPKKADRLNADLSKADVYNKLDQKNVTAWLDLRNKAAHGHYDQYTKQQVEHMYQAVAEFMARTARK